MGTRTHAGDLALAVPALARLLDADPAISFEIFGSIETPEELDRFGDRIRHVPQVASYAEFMERLASLSWTVGLCPLLATPFNAMKADTKWVEYTAAGFAVVASHGTVYDRCCADGCGLLAGTDDEWFAALRRLVDDRDLHRRTVAAAQGRIEADYTPAQLRDQMWSVFETARRLVASPGGAATDAGSGDPVGRDDRASPRIAPAERIMFVANSMIPSLQLSFVTPLQPLVRQGRLSVGYLTEVEISEHFGLQFRDEIALEWTLRRLTDFGPTLIVFCRYSGPHTAKILAWARKNRIPTVFHVDDDLLNIPIEIGEKKFIAHNRPERLEAVRLLLDQTTVTYCSTQALGRRFFGDRPPARVVSGDVYCVHEVMAPPTTDRPPTIGYMGFDHAHDFQIVLPALIRLLDARPDLTFEMFGSIPVPEELGRFGERIRTIEPVRDYDAFARTLASLGWTIGICPLARTAFNEVKADTKWVEYTASGFAVIASRGTVYDRCCADGGGLLVESADEWFGAFETLLDDKAAHRAQVERAQDKLRRDYSPERLLRQIASVFAQAHALGAQNVARENEPSPVRANLEEVFGADVKGWAWETEARSADAVPLEVWCGDTRLGWCERRVPRPDVDAHVENWGRPKGFMMPVGCLGVLFRLLNRPEGLHPRMRFCDEVFSLHDFSPHLNNQAAFRTLRSVEGVHGLRVADLWWASSRLLKIRTLTPGEKTPPAPQPTLLRAYQPLRQAAGGMGLILVDELPLSAKGDIYPVGVRTPYMPLLLVGCSDGGEICFTDLVPFPSLLRGGLHEAEVGALSEEGSDLDGFRRLSDNYAAEFLGADDHPPSFSLSAVEVDLAEAIGTEPLFDPTLRDWLATMLGVPVQATGVEDRVARDLGDRTFADHAAAGLAEIRPVPPREGGARLSLPSAAAPTVAALVARRASLAAGTSVAPHLVLDPVNPSHRWFVAIPEGGPLMREPGLSAIARRSFPTVSQGEDTAPPGDRLLPLAIVFRDLAPQADTELTFPVPTDRAEILPDLPAAGAPAVSVVVMVDGGEPDLRSLLTSIAGQVTTGAVEVIVGVTVPEWHAISYRHLLSEILPERSQLVAGLNGVNQSEALNQAAARAAGDVLVVLEPNVILHDHRTLDTLARLAGTAGAGTIGCMGVKARKPGEKPLAFKSAGFFPGRCDFSAMPGVSLQEASCDAILPRAVYPVAANASQCVAVSTAVWREAGGLSTRYLPRPQALADLAARLAEAGRTSLCTTRLSVYVGDAGTPGRSLDVYTSTQAGPWRLLPAIRASTVLRSF
ncbi:MAG: glycosyltransferase [Methylobacterium frigidaeris]